MTNLLRGLEIEVLRDHKEKITGYILLDKRMSSHMKQHIDNIPDLLIVIENILKGVTNHETQM